MENLTRWTRESDGRVMMGASLENNLPIADDGKSLKQLRRQASLSAQQVADAFGAGITRQRVAQMERQPRVLPSTLREYRRAISKAQKLKLRFAQSMDRATKDAVAKILGIRK